MLIQVETLSGDRVTLIRLKSSISSSVYRGEWSSTSPSWQTRLDPLTRDRLVAALAAASEDGGGSGEMFYMAFNDWLRTFTHLEVKL